MREDGRRALRAYIRHAIIVPHADTLYDEARRSRAAPSPLISAASYVPSNLLPVYALVLESR